MLLPTLTLLVITVLLFAYVFAVRPWHTAWGATHVHRVVKLPGDALSPHAYHAVTHAVNILASQLAAIVESSYDAIIGKTIRGTIVSRNQGAERLYGYSAAEATGQPVSMLSPTLTFG